MDWISTLWRDLSPENQAFWRNSTFWLTAAAIVLPFGWLLFAFRLGPVRVRVGYFRRAR